MTVEAASPTATPARWAALQPLRHRNFALVWFAALISNIGTWMETVAVGDLVADRTGEAGWTALVAAAGFLPMGLIAPVGGAIADRVDRRRFLLVTTLLQALCAVVLVALAATDRAAPGAITAVVFVAGCVGGVGAPAYMAMMPELVPHDDLLAAVALGQAQYNFGRVIGPALAGLAISLSSYTLAFALNAVSFTAMLVALLFLRLPRAAPGEAGTIRSRIRGGVEAARADPGLRAAIGSVSIVAITASPFIALVPAMARVRHDGGETLTSAFVTAQGVGAVAGAVLLPGVAQRIGRRRLLMIGFCALGLALGLYGAAPTPALAVVALVALGMAYICVFSGLGAVVQMRAPTALRARVLSLYFLALGVLYPVAAMIQGAIADHLGLGPVTIGSGVALVVAIGVLAVVRPTVLRSLDDLDVVPSPAGVASAPGTAAAGRAS